MDDASDTGDRGEKEASDRGLKDDVENAGEGGNPEAGDCRCGGCPDREDNIADVAGGVAADNRRRLTD